MQLNIYSEQPELESRLQIAEIAVDEILDIIEIPTHEPPQFFEHMDIPDPSPKYSVPTRSSDTSNVGVTTEMKDGNPLPTPPSGQNQDTENTIMIKSSDNDPALSSAVIIDGQASST